MDNLTFASRMRDLQMSSDLRLDTRGYSILQLDGKAFHTWTKGLDTPFDQSFVDGMNGVAEVLAEKIGGVKFAYVQSDEISLLLTDFDTEDTQAYYANRVQKIVSTSAGLASAYLSRKFADKPFAIFDARFFSAPDKETVKDWFNWRQADGIKNSVRAVGYARFAAKELENKNTLDVCDMLRELGDPWEAYDGGLQRGRLITKVPYKATTSFFHKKEKVIKEVTHDSYKWVPSAAPMFRETDSLDALIPNK